MSAWRCPFSTRKNNSTNGRTGLDAQTTRHVRPSNRPVSIVSTIWKKEVSDVALLKQTWPWTLKPVGLGKSHRVSGCFLCLWKQAHFCKVLISWCKPKDRIGTVRQRCREVSTLFNPRRKSWADQVVNIAETVSRIAYFSQQIEGLMKANGYQLPAGSAQEDYTVVVVS